MSAQPVAARTDRNDGPSVRRSSTSRAPAGTVRASLALGSAAVIGYLLVRPGPSRTDLSYPAVAAGRDAAWLGHLIESAGYGLAGFGLALAAVMIVRRRGAAWATAGAVLVSLGGVLFAAAGYAIGVVTWYATSVDVLDAGAGAALLSGIEENPGHLGVADVVGFLALTVGSLLIAVALWLSRAVPRWVPIALATLTLAQFAPWPDRALDLEQAALMGVFIAIAWFAGRPAVDAAAPA